MVRWLTCAYLAALPAAFAGGCGPKPVPTSEPAPAPSAGPSAPAPGATARSPKPDAGDDWDVTAFPKAVVGRWRLESGEVSIVFPADTEFTADGRVLQKDGEAWVERYKYEFERELLILSDKADAKRVVASLKVADVTADRLVLAWPKAALKRIK